MEQGSAVRWCDDNSVWIMIVWWIDASCWVQLLGRMADTVLRKLAVRNVSTWKKRQLGVRRRRKEGGEQECQKTAPGAGRA